MRNFLAIWWDGGVVFLRNHCFTRAAAISFYAFFSLIPFMILVTAAIGFVLGSHAGLLDKVISVVREALPYLSDRIIGDLRRLSVSWRSTGWLGLVFLLLSAEAVLAATSESLSAIFGTEERWGFVRKKIINLLILCLATVAAFISIVITAASLVLRQIKISVFGVDLSYYLIQSFTFKYALPFFLVAFMSAIVYRIFSGASLNFRYAFYGSVVFTLLWEAAKHLFTWYISNFAAYSAFYASLGTLMVLLVWIYYSVNIFLYSASVAKAAYGRMGRTGGRRTNRHAAGAGRSVPGRATAL